MSLASRAVPGQRGGMLEGALCILTGTSAPAHKPRGALVLCTEDEWSRSALTEKRTVWSQPLGPVELPVIQCLCHRCEMRHVVGLAGKVCWSCPGSSSVLHSRSGVPLPFPCSLEA